MAQGISQVLTFAIGVAISPVPIIAVILVLFSDRAKVNGPMFLAGWTVALGLVSGIAYLASDAGGASTDSQATDGVSWGQIVLGVVFLLLAGRSWRDRPEPGAQLTCRSGWPGSTPSHRARRSGSACCWRG
jgi:hypothetical protein